MQPAKSLTASRAGACVPASTSCVNRIRDYCTIKNIPRRIIPEDGGDVLVALTPACYIAMRIGIRRSHRPHLSLSLRHPRHPAHLSFSLYLSFSLSLFIPHVTTTGACVCVREIVCACPSPPLPRRPPRKSTPLHPAFDLSFSSFRLGAGDVADGSSRPTGNNR